MDKDNYIGRLLDGRYEILEVIGTGGMAVVYKARCHRLNRLVAIKILKDEFSQDEEFRRRFHAESQAVAMLSHPNIVSVYDVSSSRSADFIVMELIDGITLKQYMEKKGTLNWKETLHFAIQIAKALEHAHGRGIVHRDIKPHNVMVLKNGSVKVADFGIAQIAAKSTTLTKEALGSVHYISPEQAKGGRVDNRSDIYSLGIVMYEMIAGRVPYDGESPVNIAIQHINGGAPKPSTFNPNTPEGLEQIIAKAMGLTPQERYASATAMLYDMDEFRKDPTIVFDMENPAEKQATKALPSNLSEEIAKQPPKTIAERTAAEKNGNAKALRESRKAAKHSRPEEDDEEEGRNRVAAIAIASCVVVGIIAIIIFMVILGQGGLFTKQTYVQVPGLVGQLYENLREYPGIEVVRQGSEYSDEFQKGEIMYQYPDAGKEVVSGTKVFITVSLGEEQPNEMENLLKMKAENAEKFLNGLKLNLHIIMREEYHKDIPAGYVTRTSPAAGEPLVEGQTVTIWVSSGPEVIMAMVPNVVGKDLEDAIKTLNANGFVNVGQNPVDSDRPKNQVVGQSAEKFVKIDVTTLIVLDVSTGVPEMPVEPTDPIVPTEPEDTQSTEPTETEPSEPEQTVPDDGTVTLEHDFVVPNQTESYDLSIRNRETGEWIVEGHTVAPNTKSVRFTIKGKGSVIYDLYFTANDVSVAENDDPDTSETVEFDPDD